LSHYAKDRLNFQKTAHTIPLSLNIWSRSLLIITTLIKTVGPLVRVEKFTQHIIFARTLNLRWCDESNNIGSIRIICPMAH
jgi:hypothetical protein